MRWYARPCLLHAWQAQWVTEIAEGLKEVTEQTMHPQTILDQGYLIVRGAIEPDQLDSIRATAELFLDRARERSRGDPNVGWDSHRVPHPGLYDFADTETGGLYDPLVSDRVLDVNRRLMAAEHVGLNTASLFTQPGKQLSKTFQWHRDGVERPSAPLPLRGLQADYQANAPGVLSWNIALHDDASLWVVPGSNRRRNTAVEQEVLDRPAMLADAPLPNAEPCDLRAGDAVVFDATMLHSGSNDADRYRRTFNVAYRSFDGPVLAHTRTTYWKPDLCERLAPHTAALFGEFERLIGQERDAIAATFRSMTERDPASFRAHLAYLHPGEVGRMVCVVQLHKVAHTLWKLAAPGGAALSDADYLQVTLDHQYNRWRTAELARRFTAAEMRSLWGCFAELDRRLRTDRGRSDDSADPSDYEQVEMPAGFDVEAFIASWEPG